MHISKETNSYEITLIMFHTLTIILTHNHNHMLTISLMHMLIMLTHIKHFYMPRCIHAPIVAAKVIWLSFVLNGSNSHIWFERQTFRTQENLGTKINSYSKWYRYAPRFQDVGSGGILIVAAQGPWLGISTTWKPYQGIKKVGTVTFGDDSKGKIVGIGNIKVGSFPLTEDIVLVDGLKYNLLSIS